MEAPLELLLKNEELLRIARLQDRVIAHMYRSSNGIAMHGGTCVWRCYGGKRFSYDIDMYAKNKNEIERVINAIKLARFFVTKQKERKGKKELFYYKVSDGNTKMTVEFNSERRINRSIATYINTDGTFVDIFSISTEDLIKEKIAAYESRRAIKDLYDLYILSHFIKSEKSSENMKTFIQTIQKPADEELLKQLIYGGAVPTFSQMVDYIERHYEIYK